MVAMDAPVRLVWNLWGRECAVLQLKRGTLRVGTDDADNLVAFLRKRIAS